MAVVVAISAWQVRNLLEDGTSAPDVQLVDLQGHPHRLSELRGQPVALDFWAPWCTVCRAEASTLSSLSHKMKVVSVALDYRSVAEVRAFMAKYGVDYPVLLGDEEVARRFRITAFPTTYFLDAKGGIRHESVGYTTRFGFWWRLRF